MSGMPDYSVGDLVVCVNDTPNPTYGVRTVRCGQIYRVEKFDIVRPNALLGEGMNVYLVGVPGVGPAKVGHHIARFRKVDPLPAALTELLATTPVREQVPA